MKYQIESQYTEKAIAAQNADQIHDQIDLAINSLELNAMTAIFEKIDPAKFVGSELSARIVAGTISCTCKNDERIWSAFVEISVTPVEKITIEWWEDGDYLDDVYDWKLAQTVGTF